MTIPRPVLHRSPLELATMSAQAIYACEDHELIAVVRSRNRDYEEAAQTLMDRLGGFVAAMVQRKGPFQNDDLNEIAQNVWITAFREESDEHFATSAEFRSWLKRVAINKAIDERRKQRRRKETTSADLLMETEARYEPTDDTALALQRCMGRLDEKKPEFAVVVRSVTAGKSGEEIAESLSISRATVFTRFSRAKEWLKHCIEKRLERTLA